MSGRVKTPINFFAILAVIALAVLMLLPAAQAQQPGVTEVIKEEKVCLDIGDTVHVTRTLVFGNVADKPVVPGILTLSLQKVAYGSIGPISTPWNGTMTPLAVSNVSARLGDGSPVNVTVSQGSDATVIKYGAWIPIEPNGTVTVILEYDAADLVEKGIFFNKVVCPINASGIPIEKAVLEASINGHLTYASEAPASSDGNVYTWQKEDLAAQQWDITLEYSPLPLPMMPLDGAIVFWGALAILCLAFVLSVYVVPK